MSLARKILGAAVVGLVLTPSSALAVTPTPVQSTPDYEFDGSGNADYFAWGFVSKGHPKIARVKVKPAGQPMFSLNRRGRWFAGDMDQTGSLLPYERWVAGSDQKSDIHLYDMATRSKVADPSGVNTTREEYFAALDGGQLTFLRSGREVTLWLVTDLSTGAKIPVKSLDPSRAIFANPPNLLGNWVTYAICSRRGCEAYRYDIGAATTLRVPNPRDKLYFAPAADSAGNVYLERSASGCGQQARLMKWTSGGGAPSTFYRFGRGHDMAGTSLFDDGPGGVTVYADLYRCRDGQQDIVSFLNP